jgi:hypothetical protein
MIFEEEKPNKFEIFARRIIELSESKTYQGACSEWRVFSINNFETNCICTKRISKVIIIENRLNFKKCQVGCECVSKIENLPYADTSIGALKNLKELQEDTSNSVKKDLLDYIEYKNILETRHIEFIRDMMRKRRMSDKQRKYLQDLKNKIIKLL